MVPPLLLIIVPGRKPVRILEIQRDRDDVEQLQHECVAGPRETLDVRGAALVQGEERDAVVGVELYSSGM